MLNLKRSKCSKANRKRKKNNLFQSRLGSFLLIKLKVDLNRTIGYIEPDHNYLDEEVELAIKSTPEENLFRFCEVLAA